MSSSVFACAATNVSAAHVRALSPARDLRGAAAHKSHLQCLTPVKEHLELLSRLLVVWLSRGRVAAWRAARGRPDVFCHRRRCAGSCLHPRPIAATSNVCARRHFSQKRPRETRRWDSGNRDGQASSASNRRDATVRRGLLFRDYLQVEPARYLDSQPTLNSVLPAQSNSIPDMVVRAVYAIRPSLQQHPWTLQRPVSCAFMLSQPRGHSSAHRTLKGLSSDTYGMLELLAHYSPGSSVTWKLCRHCLLISCSCSKRPDVSLDQCRRF
jgi:hypothetical protein